MRAIFIAYTLLTVAWKTTCLIQVKGFERGSLLIKCKFDSKYKDSTKYFCKDEGSKCQRLNQDKRYKEFNFKDEGLYVVFIKQLAVTDNGNYMCAVEDKVNYTVSININQEKCYTSVAVKSHVGGDVNISCNYPSDLLDNEKYFCKYTNVFNCSNLIPEKSTASSKRFSVTNANSQNTFIVHISNVISKDSGDYWCGVRTGGNSHSVALLSEVSLTVHDPDEPPSASRVDSSLVVGVCLTLAVLMLSFGVFIYLRRKRNRTSKPVPISDHHTTRTSRDNKQACADRDYEEIVPRPLTAHRTNPQEEDPPADLCDVSDLSDGQSYAMVRFHRNPEQQSRDNTTASLQTKGAVVHTENTACEYATVKHRC